MHKSVNFTFGDFLDAGPCLSGLRLFLRVVFGDDSILQEHYDRSDFMRYVQVFNPKLLSKKLTAKYVMTKVLEYEKLNNMEIDSSFIYWFCNRFKYPEVYRFAKTWINKENRRNAEVLVKNEEGYLIGWWMYTIYSQPTIGNKIREFLKGSAE